MRIFGGHDYYDCGLSMGIDPTITLVRGSSKSISVEEAGGSLLGRKLEIKPQLQPLGVGIRSVAVVFCDRVYRGAIGSRSDILEGIWSVHNVHSFMKDMKKASIKVESRWRDEKMTLEQYFTPFVTSNKLRDYMISNKVSILVEEELKSYGESFFSVNPFTLKKLGFAKALNPYTAFQELSMWIGGVLGGTSPEIVRITDDKTLIENHGFDNKISFRGPRIA